jgi:hypothetical protein
VAAEVRRDSLGPPPHRNELWNRVRHYPSRSGGLDVSFHPAACHASQRFLFGYLVYTGVVIAREATSPAFQPVMSLASSFVSIVRECQRLVLRPPRTLQSSPLPSLSPRADNSEARAHRKTGCEVKVTLSLPRETFYEESFSSTFISSGCSKLLVSQSALIFVFLISDFHQLFTMILTIISASHVCPIYGSSLL